MRGCVNGAFSAGPDPDPALLTDGQQMAFCVQREREKEGEKKRRDTEKRRRREAGGGS